MVKRYLLNDPYVLLDVVTKLNDYAKCLKKLEFHKNDVYISPFSVFSGECMYYNPCLDYWRIEDGKGYVSYSFDAVAQICRDNIDGVVNELFKYYLHLNISNELKRRIEGEIL